MEQNEVKIRDRSRPKKQPMFDRCFGRFGSRLGAPKGRIIRGGSRSTGPSGRFWPHLGPLEPILPPTSQHRTRFWDLILALWHRFWNPFGWFWDPISEHPGLFLVPFWGSCASGAETDDGRRGKPRARHGGGHSAAAHLHNNP